MTNTIKLSNRLSKVASYLPKGAFFADIGSDHAYLPCFVCLHDKTANAIAGEINEGPFNSAIDTVITYELEDVVEVRLGNGLQVLNRGEVNQLVIAGMGGSLIRTILDEGYSKLNKVERIIVQPNVDARNIRRWFLEHGFTVTNEDIIEENGHIYEVIVADSEAASNPYTEEIKEQQLLFGPLLLKSKSKAFYNKWKNESEKLERIIEQMNNARVDNKEKISQFVTELKWIREVIQDEEEFK